MAFEGNTENGRRTIEIRCGILLLIVLSVFVCASIPGEVVSPLVGNSTGNRTIAYEHGWPRTWLFRTHILDKESSAGKGAQLPHMGVPYLSWDSWKFWNYSEAQFLGRQLAIDLLVCIFATVAIARGAMFLRGRIRSMNSFSIKELLAATTVLCCALGWWVLEERTHALEQEHVDAIWDEGHLVSDAYHGPLFLRKLFGLRVLPEFLTRSDWVTLKNVDNASLQKILPHLQGIEHLRRIDIERQPEEIDLEFSLIKSLTQFDCLVLDNAALTENDIRGLIQLEHLSEICFWTKVMPESRIVNELKQALPNTRITSEPSFPAEWWQEDY